MRGWGRLYLVICGAVVREGPTTVCYPVASPSRRGAAPRPTQTYVGPSPTAFGGAPPSGGGGPCVGPPNLGQRLWVPTWLLAAGGVTGVVWLSCWRMALCVLGGGYSPPHRNWRGHGRGWDRADGRGGYLGSGLGSVGRSSPGAPCLSGLMSTVSCLAKKQPPRGVGRLGVESVRCVWGVRGLLLRSGWVRRLRIRS